ncbi:MAG: beta-lactamase family protein [Algicola sp.]|nr:beta-lactamase family protein [Algicola sp.]
MRIFITLTLFILFSSQLLASENKSLPKRLDTLMKTANELVGFNGAILVGTSTKVLYHNRIGFADKQKKLQLTEQHLFSAGSIAKELTTVAIMKLVEDGKISYQDSVSKYFPKLNPWANKVTIKHLMTHTSGLPRIHWIDNVDSVDVAEQIEKIEKLAFTPGEGFLYGNINIVLRAHIVEAVTKMDFQAFLQQQIFDVANMRHSVNPGSMKQHTASMVYKIDPNAIEGMTFFTTPYDIYQFELALWQQKFILAQSIKAALPGDLLSGSSTRALFDFGRFSVNSKNELLSWEHDGNSPPDHYALKFHDFENDLIIVMMSSDGNRTTLFDLKLSILSIINDGNSEIPLAWWFQNEMTIQGFDGAYNQLQQRFGQDTKADNLEFDVNRLGYKLLIANKAKQAVRLFKLNVTHYPFSANAYDSYGEALIKSDQLIEASNILKQGLALAKQQKNGPLVKSLTEQIQGISQQ